MIKEGTEVRWNWAAGDLGGKVKRVFFADTVIEVNGKMAKARASKEEPAYLIERRDGKEILKSSKEVYTVH